MSWKKNAFSYGIWFVYTIMTGLALLTLGTEICGMAGFGEYMGIVLALVWTAVAGGTRKGYISRYWGRCLPRRFLVQGFF